ncbi:MAG: acyl-CoA reductase [Cyclobacteriaceae bacterium]
MELHHRIELFAALGKRISGISKSEMEQIAQSSFNQNNWFTTENVKLAFDGINKFLDKETLTEWCSNYDVGNTSQKIVGVVMAGNIPMVGFHDLLSVLISGHQLAAKLSSSDTYLMKWILNELYELEPKLKQIATSEERLNHVDAVIATGSDNSARYFEYYFSKKPHIIRKNRTSCAILTGGESAKDYEQLATDIFTYFGLGCRNVSKLFVPENFDFPKMLDCIEGQKSILDHHKYQNNYDYNKSIYLVNNEPHFDTGFLLLRESDQMVSPISVVYYETYRNEQHLEVLLNSNATKIQCVVGSHPLANVPFGKAQCPAVEDYADGVDTLAFLEKL